ncbi:MAG: hypothetical protein ACRC37_02575, partial [Lentisphaeria bacterium]
RLREIIGRKGDISSIINAISLLKNNHIDNINFDLIFNIPTQTAQEWTDDLNYATSFPISHISTYSLSIEENTALANFYDSIDQQQSIDFFHITYEFLKNKNFDQYEISNFSKPNKLCKHNNGIWHGEAYLGLGPAAASFNGSLRWQQPQNINLWLNNHPPEIDQIPPIDRARELFIIGLRTTAGWQLDQFTAISHFSLDQLYNPNIISSFVNQKLMLLQNNHISLTPRGLLLADQIAISLI